MRFLFVLVAPPAAPNPRQWVGIGIRLAIVVAVAFLVVRLLYVVVGRVQRMIHTTGGSNTAAEQRSLTIAGVLRRTSAAIVVLAALIEGLAILGLDVRPLLAGAGIAGLAVGLGAQSLVKDLIAGVQILAENRFAVGDVIEVDGRTSIVEEITLRTTRLRDQYGYVVFVPNGDFRTVVNRSRDWNRTLVDVLVAADEDGERALDVCRVEVRGFNEDPAWRDRQLEPAETWGIESLGATTFTIRVASRTRPGNDSADVARELRRRLQGALVRAKIRTEPRRELRQSTEP